MLRNSNWRGERQLAADHATIASRRQLGTRGWSPSRSAVLGSMGRVRTLDADRRLGGGEAGDRHAEGRAGHVVEAGLMAEGDGGGIAAMLATNADLEAGARPASALGAQPHELAD